MTTISRIEGIEAPAPKNSLVFWLIVTMLGILLFGIQVLMGAQVEYAALIFTFTLLTAAAFKMAGGIGSFMGFVVLFLGLQHVIFSQWVKVFFLQRPDEIIWSPIATLTMYNVGMAGLLVGAAVLRMVRIDRWRKILPSTEDTSKLLLISVILLILSTIRAYVISRYGIVEQGGLYIGGFVGFWRNLQFPQFMAIAAGTAYAIIKSDGKRCLNFINVTALLVSFAVGIIYGVRNDMVFAALTFVTTCLAYGFKFGVRHYLLLGVLVFLFFRVMSPYSLYARSEGRVRVGSLEDRIAAAGKALTDVIYEPNRYRRTDDSVEVSALPYDEMMTHYFKVNNNVLERFAILCVASSVVYNTDLRGTTGGERIAHGWQMVLPRVINPEKPGIGTANKLAHQGIGLVHPTDNFTQVVLGFMVDAYNAYGLYATFLASALIMIGVGVVMAVTFGTQIHRNYMLCGLFWMFAESFSEGTIARIIVTWTFDIANAVIFLLFLVLLSNAFTRRSRSATYVYEHERGAAREVIAN